MGDSEQEQEQEQAERVPADDEQQECSDGGAVEAGWVVLCAHSRIARAPWPTLCVVAVEASGLGDGIDSERAGSVAANVGSAPVLQKLEWPGEAEKEKPRFWSVDREHRWPLQGCCRGCVEEGKG